MSDEDAESDLFALRPIDMLELAKADLHPLRFRSDVDCVGAVRARCARLLNKRLGGFPRFIR
ncbi:MAG TPA: hypothetical protein VHR64_13245 [Thermomicrobiales bacterium]|nr:hypothetical protein [Thermomicrobiales bacterium]